MKPTDKIDLDGETALQELAHTLEEIAEGIRGHGWRGCEVGKILPTVKALREVTQRLELLTHCEE